MKPSLLTHVYNFTSQELVSFTYDDTDTLISITRGKSTGRALAAGAEGPVFKTQI